MKVGDAPVSHQVQRDRAIEPRFHRLPLTNARSDYMIDVYIDIYGRRYGQGPTPISSRYGTCWMMALSRWNEALAIMSGNWPRVGRRDGSERGSAGVTVSQWRYLRELWEEDALTVGDLTRRGRSAGADDGGSGPTPGKSGNGDGNQIPGRPA